MVQISEIPSLSVIKYNPNYLIRSFYFIIIVIDPSYFFFVLSLDKRERTFV